MTTRSPPQSGNNTPGNTPRKKRNSNNSNNKDGNNKPPKLPSNALLFLFGACFWPIFVLALFAASTPPQLDENTHEKISLFNKKNIINQDVRFNFRNIMDRVDIMGYGPTHPRIAVIIVGNDRTKILSTVESVFR